MKDYRTGSPTADISTDLLCVQSIYCTDVGDVWILDAGHSPVTTVISPQAAKLIRAKRIDGKAEVAVERIYYFTAKDAWPVQSDAFQCPTAHSADFVETLLFELQCIC